MINTKHKIIYHHEKQSSQLKLLDPRDLLSYCITGPNQNPCCNCLTTPKKKICYKKSPKKLRYFQDDSEVPKKKKKTNPPTLVLRGWIWSCLRYFCQASLTISDIVKLSTLSFSEKTRKFGIFLMVRLKRREEKWLIWHWILKHCDGN